MHMTQCCFCKGPVNNDRVQVIRQWSGQVIVIENVPAQVCEQCGERYYSAAVCRELDRLMDTAGDSDTRLSVPVVRFDREPVAAA